MDNTVTTYTNNIASLIKNVSISYYERKYDEVLRNSRIATEHIAKLVLLYQKIIKPEIKNIFVDFVINIEGQDLSIRISLTDTKFTVKHPGQSPRPLMLNDLLKIIEKMNLINNYEVFDALRYMRIKGNEASHSNDIIFSENDAANARESLNKILQWLFIDILKDEMPQEIKNVLKISSFNLRYFTPVESLLRIERYNNLFNNGLIYHTPEEEKSVSDIVDTTIKNRVYLITGTPASGKSIMALTISKEFEKKEYMVYYHSFKYENVGHLWEDVKNCLYKKILFIVDDCHLNIEETSMLIYRFNSVINETNACILLVSRKIDKDSHKLGDISTIDQIEQYEIDLNSNDFHRKTVGIIGNYKNFYLTKILNKKFETGSIEKVSINCCRNFFILFEYLKNWQTSELPLCDINLNLIYKETYNKYFNRMTSAEFDCLLKYSSLYLYEIEFEPLPDRDKETQKLLELGLIEINNGKYTFLHSDLANLFINSYVTNNIYFKREFKNKDQFIFKQIKGYICGFKNLSYPSNVKTIVKNLFVNNEYDFLKKLLNDDEVRELISNYYASDEINNVVDISSFICFNVIAKTSKETLSYYFSNVILHNENFKKLLLKSEKSLELYNALLYILYIQKNDLFDTFMKYLSYEEEKQIFVKAFIKDYLSENDDDVQNEFGPDSELIYKLFEVKGFIIDAVVDLKKIIKTREIFKQINPDELSEIICMQNDADNIVEIFNVLNDLDEETANKLNLNEYLKKLDIVYRTSYSLSELSSLSEIENAGIRKTIESCLNFEITIEVLKKINYDSLIVTLGYIKKISPDVYDKLTGNFDLTSVIEKIKSLPIIELLNELKSWKTLEWYNTPVKNSNGLTTVKTNDEIYDKILKNIKLDELIEQNKKYAFNLILLVNDIYGFEYASNILKNIRIKINEQSESDLTRFFEEFEILHKLSSDKSINLLKSINLKTIVKLIELKPFSASIKILKTYKMFSSDNYNKIINAVNYKNISNNFFEIYSKSKSKIIIHSVTPCIENLDPVFTHRILSAIEINRYVDYLLSQDFEFNLLRNINKIDAELAKKILSALKKEKYVELIKENNYDFDLLVNIKSIFPELAGEILGSFDLYDLFALFKNGKLLLTSINDINQNIVDKILNISFDQILLSLNKVNFADLCEHLNFYNKINVDCCLKLLNDLSIDTLIKKANEEELFELSEAFNKLNLINSVITKRVISRLDIEQICDNIKESSYRLLSKSLNSLNNIDSSVPLKIINAMNFESYIEYFGKLSSHELILKDLLYLSVINFPQFNLLKSFLNLNELKNEIDYSSYYCISENLLTLSKIDCKLAQELFDLIGGSEILELAKSEVKDIFDNHHKITLNEVIKDFNPIEEL
ncbi:MAG: hypothetical protein ACD_59C00063G0002 [uncultured bacterium]|nr:MAG: hypothetical protein ACD_59C00063G0002 [uncultured bacterium]